MLAELARLLGLKPHIESTEFHKELIAAGLPPYTPDVYGEPRQQGLYGVILENDGRVGHTSHIAFDKMSRRDAWFWCIKGIRTIRFPTADLVGKKALDREGLLLEYCYQFAHFDSIPRDTFSKMLIANEGVIVEEPMI